MSNEKIKKDIDEMRLLLISNMFEEVTDENLDRLDYFYTPFQIKLKIKAPLYNNEYNMALQFLGLRSFYEGHTIPTNPDTTAFIIKENNDGERYIQTLIRKSMLDEIENFIAEDENFNQYMKEKCYNDFKAFTEEKDFFTLGITTSGPSENFSHLLAFSACQIKDNKNYNKKSMYLINNNFSEKDIEEYTTPFADGMKSAFQKTRIAVPGMKECLNESDFISQISVLRKIYAITKDSNLIIDDITKTRNFIGKLLKNNNLQDDFNIDLISANCISIRRLSKYLFNEYFSMYELAKHLKFRNINKFGSLGEAEILVDLFLILKNQMEQILKEKENRMY